MDAFTYSYVKDGTGNIVTNKLDHVDDITSSGNYSDDIDDQSAMNYDYDNIGNLVSDVTEDIQTIEWNVMGKIKNITRSSGSGTNKPDIEFGYDNMGNRLFKKIKPRVGGTLLAEDQWTYTWYVRDASGNVMATYNQKDSLTGTNAYGRVLKLKERNLYGGKRVGVLDENLNTVLASFTNSGGNFNSDGTYQSVSSYTITLTADPGDYQQRTLGRKLYELVNHLGNVLGVITDRRLSADGLMDGVVDYYAPEFVSSSDYYAFGAPMPGRNANAGDYRYGFGGMEKDPEDGLNTTDYRQYDSRLGRWLSTDPIVKPWESPYAGFSNNPIYYTDPSGLDPGPPEGKGEYEFQELPGTEEGEMYSWVNNGWVEAPTIVDQKSGADPSWVDFAGQVAESGQWDNYVYSVYQSKLNDWHSVNCKPGSNGYGLSRMMYGSNDGVIPIPSEVKNMLWAQAQREALPGLKQAWAAQKSGETSGMTYNYWIALTVSTHEEGTALVGNIAMQVATEWIIAGATGGLGKFVPSLAVANAAKIEAQLALRSDIILSGGRSGNLVKELMGPANSVLRGGTGRIFITNESGQVIWDITKARAKPVIPGQGFGPKMAPTQQQLNLIELMWGK